MSNIYAISDLHGQLPSVPSDATSLIVVGDICPDYITEKVNLVTYDVIRNDGAASQAKWLDVRFREWARHAGVPIYATFGNHDFVGEHPYLWPEIENVEFVIDDSRDVEGFKTWFHPWTPRLSGWALKAETPEAEVILSVVPDDIDILATHGPPLGAGDAVPITSRFNGGPYPIRTGEEALNRAIPRIDPQVVLCGHIHEDKGEHVLPGSEHVVLNASSMNDDYVQYERPFVDLTPYLS